MDVQSFTVFQFKKAKTHFNFDEQRKQKFSKNSFLISKNKTTVCNNRENDMVI